MFNWDGEHYSFSGRVEEINELTYYNRVIVALQKPKTKLALHLPLEEGVKVGEIVSFAGSVSQPSFARNPGEFCYRSYLYSKGVSGVSVPDDFTVLGMARFSVLQMMREFVARNLDKVNDSALLKALVLGEKRSISTAQREKWSHLGTAHLLAISGMHIGLLSGVLWVLINRLSFGDNFKVVFLSMVLLAYVLLTGGSPSSWRAYIMCVLAMIWKSRERQIDSLHVWSFAGTLMLLFSPTLLNQVSFQLSFAASGGILLWSPWLFRIGISSDSESAIRRQLLKVLRALLVSVIAQFSLYPLLAIHFQEIALFSPITTLVFFPLVIIILIGGILLGFLGSIPYVGDVLVKVLEVLMRLINKIELWFEPFTIVLPLKRPGWAIIFIWYFAFIYLGWLLRKKRIFPLRNSLKRGLIWVLVCLNLLSLPSELQRPFEVTVIDVGQGDSILISTPWNQNILIDGGGDSVYWQLRGRNVGEQTLLPFLKYNDIDQIDLVILSHPHEDHLFGLLAVLENVPVGMVIDNGQLHTTSSYYRYLELMYERGIEYKTVRAGDALELRGGVVVEILHPSELLTGTSSDLNNNSLVVLLKYRGWKFLFTGDLDKVGQMALLTNANLEGVDWLKVPHHGSTSAWYPPFFEQIKPTYAVIPVGTNSFGQPSKLVLDGLNDLGTKVWRTDLNGAVTFRIWGGLFGRFFAMNKE